MYVPEHFREDDLPALHGAIARARLATLVTTTAEGLIGTPLPLLLAADEGPLGTLYGHLARANPQARLAPVGEALAIFAGPEAYVSPAWYPSKAETHKVVPTWNYVAVHVYGALETFTDTDRLRDLLARLTDRHEAGRAEPWSLADAPEDYVAAMLKGIVGVRIPIARLDGKSKMSQNKSAADRSGVAAGLAAAADPRDREVAPLIPR
ncbi:Transcriptional regulator [uncultured Alphaproteobacteria bacterium]|uniref:Transcriptional regulator n=1 Tax=uncultured Alphaproteobacteria bacterium TaxID=91750 RepID=A0A212KI51_9PROT|nr:Transcriptional regulator [uncultured Alphaproteobacteria bacterium]